MVGRWFKCNLAFRNSGTFFSYLSNFPSAMRDIAGIMPQLLQEVLSRKGRNAGRPS